MLDKILYLFDTNILLHDSQSLLQFPQGIVGIPLPVISELDSFKKESSERGYNAREAIRILDELRQSGSLIVGVPLSNGGVLKIILLPDSIVIKAVDDQIIALALFLKTKGQGVVVISKDIALRIKADAVGVETNDYKSDSISKDNFYQGWKEFYASSSEIKLQHEVLLKKISKEYAFSVNEFAYIKSHNSDHIYRIFRYNAQGKFIEINPNAALWGICARNPFQAMAMDLLLDDNIQLVILLGPSGTGKTFLVLASLLNKVLATSTYQKLLISRPLVPLGPDVGYLPGDLQEKLQTWMQPIRDNMEYLLYQMNSSMAKTKQPSENDEANSSKQHHHHKKHKKGNCGNERKGCHISIDDLLGEYGKVSLEAITYMRGRSIPHQAIFIDEVQNLTPHEVKTLISRAGEKSKVVLAGDPYQIDSPYLDFTSNGLVVASERFKGQEVFGTVYLQISERSLLSSLANMLM